MFGVAVTPAFRELSNIVSQKLCIYEVPTTLQKAPHTSGSENSRDCIYVWCFWVLNRGVCPCILRKASFSLKLPEFWAFDRQRHFIENIILHLVSPQIFGGIPTIVRFSVRTADTEARACI